MGANYTYKTLTHLSEFLSSFNRKYFLIGDDQIEKFHLWSHYQEVLKIVDIIVIKRNSTLDIKELAEKLKQNFATDISIKNNYLEVKLDNHISKIYFIDLPVVDLSSTELRNSESFELSKSVKKYIEQNNLYVGV